MPLSKDEFERGIKPLEKGSLEYRILNFLRKNKSAYTLSEIIDAFDARDPENFAKTMFIVVGFQDALNNLVKSGTVISKTVKTDISGESELYYMAK